MAVTLVNASNFSRGVAADQDGINIEEQTVTVKPEFKDFLYSRQNAKRGFAVGDPEAEVTIRGEINAATGVMGATFAAAVTISNTTAYFGVSNYSFYMDEGTVTQARADWKKLDAKYSGNAGIP